MEILVRHEADLGALGNFEYLNVRNADVAVRFLTAVDRTNAHEATWIEP